MTNKEALAAMIIAAVPDNTLVVALINGDVAPEGTYVKANKEAVEKVELEVLYGLFTAQDISEGGYSVSHPDFLRKVKERIGYLAKLYSRTDILDAIFPKPRVTSKSVW